jgi:hypothetical protein
MTAHFRRVMRLSCSRLPRLPRRIVRSGNVRPIDRSAKAKETSEALRAGPTGPFCNSV